MADIRDWGAFVRGRWDWSRHGYEKGFPRGCQFTDLDGAVEFNGQRLVIEPKHHDGLGPCNYPDTGQLLFLRDEVKLGKAVIVLYGCGPCNSPQAIRVLGTDRSSDRFEDWRRGRDLPERRRLLKTEIDRALGLLAPELHPEREFVPKVEQIERELHIADPTRPAGEWADVDTVRPPDWKGGAA